MPFSIVHRMSINETDHPRTISARDEVCTSLSDNPPVDIVNAASNGRYLITVRPRFKATLFNNYEKPEVASFGG